MTELEKITYAKSFIDQMANGINPLDGTPVPDGEVLSQVRVSRCLFYVSGLLQQMIDRETVGAVSDPHMTERMRKTEFALTEDARAQLYLSGKPLTISEITEQLNGVVDRNTVKRISGAAINRWLVSEGILEETEINGRQRKCPTAAGESIGILAEEREGQNGFYTVLLYSADAQALIYDNVDAIVAYNLHLRNEKQQKKAEQSTDLQGSPWTEEQEMKLIELFQSGADLGSMASAMRRTKTGIRARLVRLGLIDNRQDI